MRDQLTDDDYIMLIRLEMLNGNRMDVIEKIAKLTIAQHALLVLAVDENELHFYNAFCC